MGQKYNNGHQVNIAIMYVNIWLLLSQAMLFIICYYIALLWVWF